MTTDDITSEAPYETPILRIEGTLEKITKAGSAPNADVEGGEDNTAFSV